MPFFLKLCIRENSFYPMGLSFAEMVPNDIQSELKHLYVAVGELLRHFWSCFPVNTPFLEEKVRARSHTANCYHSVTQWDASVKSERWIKCLPCDRQWNNIASCYSGVTQWGVSLKMKRCIKCLPCDRQWITALHMLFKIHSILMK